MKALEVHKMNDEEMRQEVTRLRKRLYEVRCQSVTEKLENPKQIGHIRKDIARILTEQRARKIRQETAK